MKKISILFLTLLLILLTLYAETIAQPAATVKKAIEQSNKQFIRWFNTGQADSIVNQYHPNACLADGGCGKDYIKNYYVSETGKYKFKELTTLNVTVNGNTATETGHWKLQLSGGTELSGRYQSEWQLVKNKWLILKETILE